MPILIRNIVLVPALVVLSFTAKVVCERHLHVPSARNLTLSPEDSRIQILTLTKHHFGFRHVLADLLWVRLLQANDHTPVGHDKVSWEYGQLEAIIRLDPHFSRAYSFGAIFLTVLRQDRLGAQFILERWAKRYPKNYRPYLLLGFLHYNDLKDYKKGAEYILKAATMPYAPEYLSALGIRLASQSGASAQNLALSIELYETVPLETSRERLRVRIRDLAFQLQLTAWNDAVGTAREALKREPNSLEEIRPYMQRRLGESLVLLPGQVAPDVAEILRKTYSWKYDPRTKRVESAEKDTELGQIRIYSSEGDSQ